MGKVSKVGLGLLGFGVPIVFCVGMAFAGQASPSTVDMTSTTATTTTKVLATHGYEQMSSTLAQTAPQLTVTQTWHTVTTGSGTTLLIDPPHVGCNVVTSGL